VFILNADNNLAVHTRRGRRLAIASPNAMPTWFSWAAYQLNAIQMAAYRPPLFADLLLAFGSLFIASASPNLPTLRTT